MSFLTYEKHGYVVDGFGRQLWTRTSVDHNVTMYLSKRINMISSGFPLNISIVYLCFGPVADPPSSQLVLPGANAPRFFFGTRSLPGKCYIYKSKRYILIELRGDCSCKNKPWVFEDRSIKKHTHTNGGRTQRNVHDSN